MSNFDGPIPETQYVAVFRAADEVLAMVQKVAGDHERLSGRDPEWDSWASGLLIRVERAAALLSVAGAKGNLVRYEAAVRAILAEGIPMQDAPRNTPAITAAMSALELLAEVFSATLPRAVPDAGAVSLPMATASRMVHSRDFGTRVAVEVHASRRRAAASDSDRPTPELRSASFADLTVSASLTHEDAELWIVSSQASGATVVPVSVITDQDRPTLFFGLLLPREDMTGRAARLSARPPVDRLEVRVGDPVEVTDLGPWDAADIEASLRASSRSWKKGWRNLAREISWLAAVVSAVDEIELEDG